MTEQHGGPEGPERPLPPRPPAPPSYSGTAAGESHSETQGDTPGNPQTEPLANAVPAQGQPGHGNGPAAYGSSAYGSTDSGSAFHAPAGTTPAPESRAKKFGTGTLVAGMLLAGLFGGGVAVGANTLMDDGNTAGQASQPQTVVVNDEDSVNSVTAAAVKASPSVVTIEVAASGSTGTGSGIILDEDGHILTNTHVVTLGGTAADPVVEVQTADGRVLTATIVGTDPLSDLAVIKVDAPDLTPAALGDSGNLNVGDTVIAIGAPLGLSGTVTDGIVSTLNRTISVQSSAAPEESESSDEPEDNGFGFRFAPPDGSSQDQSTAESSIFLNVVQTDAAINHGNSGGALVNTDGEVIGVNVAIASAASGAAGEDSGNIGVGFAVPITYAERVAEEIIDNGSATHGYLGVSVTPATASDSSSTFTVGAEVAEVVSGSPGEKAGLRKGDVVTSVNGIPVTDAQSLTAAIRMQPAGGKATIDFTRDGKTDSVDATLGDSAKQ
ncbi:S1C family serine protease [Arthrobacter sp. zg-Y1110]|uniref:S1C family serine protease n=1 Tax=Arthrobacter sp. zg-Y1110 TaxID=2886932 RepID=UPI001D15707A|nr:trypsin-like peptidase domain-containing protein [Arthrobacter sp. zg-Y1110]MCC3290440.1 trypsin-like peptidase domain-containing protein [Arthrobacter sp. zg-Y1110]UWX84190.1 trypsin-like peptidase domain-containing protein [Arthrobacter sp. zg-Y1110]